MILFNQIIDNIRIPNASKNIPYTQYRITMSEHHAAKLAESAENCTKVLPYIEVAKRDLVGGISWHYVDIEDPSNLDVLKACLNHYLRNVLINTNTKRTEGSADDDV